MGTEGSTGLGGGIEGGTNFLLSGPEGSPDLSVGSKTGGSTCPHNGLDAVMIIVARLMDIQIAMR